MQLAHVARVISKNNGPRDECELITEYQTKPTVDYRSTRTKTN